MRAKLLEDMSKSGVNRDELMSKYNSRSAPPVVVRRVNKVSATPRRVIDPGAVALPVSQPKAAVLLVDHYKKSWRSIATQRAPTATVVVPAAANGSEAKIATSFDIGNKCTASEHAVIHRVLTDCTHAFASRPTEAPMQSPDVVHSIVLLDKQPCKQRAYRVSPDKEKAIEEQTAELLARKLIRPSSSAWSSPIVMVPKPDGTWRQCIDYRRLNAQTVKDSYPIPLIQDCTNMCRDANWLTLIDIKDAYHHIAMDPACISMTAFTTPRGLYEWLRMPFGLCNAPATFQRYVDASLRGLIGKICAAFFDDCLVYTTGSIEEHAEHVRTVLDRLSRAGLECNMKKCKFAYDEMLFVGHIVSKGTVRPDPNKVRAVTDFPVPTNLSELRSFLGLTNYYHDFIAGFAVIAKDLYHLTRKAVEYVWDAKAQAAFDRLKAALLSSKCLYSPNFALPFILQTDASGDGIAAVLTQVVDGAEHPVGFISRQLSVHEKNYSAIEWECLAVVWAVGVFEVYLVDAPFTVVTDHAPLRWLPTKRMGNSRLQRWALTLSEFSFTVLHRAGKKNGNVDALSRMPVHGSAPTDLTTDPPFAPTEIKPHYIRTHLLSLAPFPTLVALITSARQTVQVAPSAAVSSSQRTVNATGTAEDEHSVKGLESISLVDGSKLKKLVDAQYAEPALLEIIEYKLKKAMPMHLADEASKRRFVGDCANYTLLEQSDDCRPALFYLPIKPKRGLSSLVPVVPRLIVPVVYRPYIISMYHDYAFGAHLGERRTYSRVSVNYYWYGCLDDCVKYVSSCTTCQSMKVQRRTAGRPKGIIDEPSAPFELVSMDFVGPMNPKSGDFEYILVLVDHFSRWAITVPCISTTAEVVARILVNEVYCRYGTPKRLLSDRGTQFHSTLLRELHKYLNVKQLFTAAHHPQTNGMVERFNGTLKNMLFSVANEFGTRWDDALQSVTFAYNTSPHEATGITPYYCLYGREAIVPGDALAIAAAMPDRDINVPQELYTQYTLDNIIRSREWVQTLLKLKREEQAKQILGYARIPSYKVGDRVSIKNPMVVLATGGRGDKVQYFGPYIIVKKLGEITYECQSAIANRSQKTIVVNVDRLRLYSDRVESLKNTHPFDDAANLPSQLFIAPSSSRREPMAVGSHRKPSGIGPVLPADDEDDDIPDVTLAAAPLAPIAREDSDAVLTHPSGSFLDRVSHPTDNSSVTSSSTSSAVAPFQSVRSRTNPQSRAIMSDDFLSRLPSNEPHTRHSQPSSATPAPTAVDAPSRRSRKRKQRK